jgi:hypothetical protein
MLCEMCVCRLLRQQQLLIWGSASGSRMANEHSLVVCRDRQPAAGLRCDQRRPTADQSLQQRSPRTFRRELASKIVEPALIHGNS